MIPKRSTILKRGAEAILFLEDGKIIKERVEKKYRHGHIDKSLRKSRTASEAKLLVDARRAGVNTPVIYDVGENKIVMQFLDGKKLKDLFDEMDGEKRKKICFEIGRNVSLLHKYDIIHGDLTTSNMILLNDRLYFVDFGLGEISRSIEKKATDLHLLRQVFENTHSGKGFGQVLEGYKSYERAEEVIERLEQIKKRGRYK